MAESKTRATDADVTAFLKNVSDERRCKDAFRIMELMQEITGEPPRMWGGSMVGFGQYHYVYASGREGDWFLTGFSPRAKALSLYIMAGFDGYEDLMADLGKYKTGKSCLYVTRLEDIHLPTLKKLIRKSVTHMRRKYR